jgi:GntR family transcriptional regulator
LDEEFRLSPRDEAAEKIESFIIKNKLQPHTKIPSERDMCELWGFNRTTLRSALKRLLEEGKLYNKLGSGTYIAPLKVVRNLQDLRSLAEYTQDYGSVLTTKLLSLSALEANKKISQKLHVPLGTQIYELVRIRSINDEPALIDTVFIEYDRFPNFDQIDFSKKSLNNVIRTEFGIRIIGGEEKIGITYTSSYEAKILGIAVETPVFLLTGNIWDENEEPITYFKSVVRADKVRFASVLKW